LLIGRLAGLASASPETFLRGRRATCGRTGRGRRPGCGL